MRGLFGSFAPRVRRSGAGEIGGGAWFPFLGSVKSASGIAVNQSTAMRASAVFACVNIISEDIARAEPKLYRPLPDRTLADGRKAPGGREQVKDHPLARLFRRPNRVQDWYQFAGFLERSIQLKSNAYAIILRDRKGDPSELIPMNPDKVTVLEAADGSIFYQFAPVGLFELSILTKLPAPYAGFRVPSEHVFHMQELGFNMLMGASRIGFAADSIGLSLGQEKQAGAWVNNGARPSVVLTTEAKLTPDAAKRMKQDWEELSAGLANTGRTAVLEQGLKPELLSLTSVDLEFLASRGFQVEDICRFFRVPPHKVAKTDRSTNNNIEAQDADYTNNTLSPKFTRWERRLEFHFGLDLEGLEVDFDLSDLFRAAPTARMLIARQGVAGGVLTQNQAIALYDPNLPMQPDGDRLLSPTNLAASGSQASGSPADGGGRPRSGEEDI
jgi:HK97 family phage portal protein